MRLATRTLLAALGLVLFAGTASAQNDVTFQVNLKPYIDSCQFDPMGSDSVLVRGSFNDWSNAPDGGGEATYNVLTDADEDGTYTGTFSLEAGEINYKFYAGTPETDGDDELGYEDGDNRTYTVVEGAQTIPTVQLNKGDVVDSCGKTTETYDVTFVVDMTQQIARGSLDPATEKVAVAGSFTGWDGASAFQLTPESDNTNIYSGTLTRDFEVPTSGAAAFKFVILSPNDTGGFDITDYDQPRADVSPLAGGDGSNRLLVLTGDEETDSESGNKFYVYDNDDDDTNFVLYSDADPSAFLSGPAKVTFVVDMRPAFYALEDDGSLPGDLRSITDVYINGPIFGESDEADGPGEGAVVDWAAWTAEGLGTTRRLGNYNSTDSTYSVTLNYSLGANRVLQGKLSIGGPDNEAGAFDDKFVTVNTGDQTVNLIFGAQIKTDGTFSDNTDAFDAYDPYILIDNSQATPTATVVRSGGESDVAVGIEDGPGIDGLAIGAAYPNPTRGAASLDLTLDRALDLRVVLYDVVGRQVATLADGPAAAGETTIGLDVSGLAPGLYLLRVEADGQAVTRRMTVLR